MAFVNPASAVIVGAVDSHHLLGLYPWSESVFPPASVPKRIPISKEQ